MLIRSERGAGSVLAIGMVAAVTVVALAIVGLAVGLAARQRIIGAADAAALAAADTALGHVAGAPCEVAAATARANGGVLAACRLDGLVATVEVRGTFAGIPLGARSRAGPPR